MEDVEKVSEGKENNVKKIENVKEKDEKRRKCRKRVNEKWKERKGRMRIKRKITLIKTRNTNIVETDMKSEINLTKFKLKKYV